MNGGASGVAIFASIYLRALLAPIFFFNHKPIPPIFARYFYMYFLQHFRLDRRFYGGKPKNFAVDF